MGLSKLAVISTVLAAVLLCLTPAASQETENQREFSYDRGSEVGPSHWGEIHPEWALCQTGRMQSPIDLSDDWVQVLPHLRRLRRFHRPAAAVLMNRGHDIMIKWKDEAGAIFIDRTEYKLKQLHWHSPSEHTINGRNYSLEMHMVHQSADEKIAVVGVLYKIGRPDPLLAKMEEYIKSLENSEGAEKNVGIVDPMEIELGRKYYRYMGSLTTPPCTEGVVWTVIKKVQTVSVEQVKLLKEAVHEDYKENARPIQPINGRIVGLYDPEKFNNRVAII